MSDTPDVKKLLEEVRSLRAELDMLKINPAISQAIGKTVLASGAVGKYNVSYGVAFQSYNVLVMPQINLGDEVESGDP